MLSARSVVILLVSAISLGLLISVLGLRRDPNSGGVGRDSFGVRAHGYRGVFELLDRLDVPAHRSIAPPSADDPADATVALLAPSPRFVEYEPAYLERLADWVEGGGRVVVAPPTRETIRRFTSREDEGDRGDRDGVPKAALLESLGLGGVRVVELPSASGRVESNPTSLESWQWRQSRAQQANTTLSFMWRGRDEGRMLLALPEGDGLRLETGSADYQPILSRSQSDDNDLLLAAAFPRGEGEVVVVADPDLFANALLAEADNSVAAMRLLSPEGGPVVFDEHYHGLSVRGNALYLLTYPGFAAATLATLVAVGVWAWRTTVPLGPPAPTPARPRRDLREYVEAMARLLLRGRDGRRFLLQELRRGAIEELGRQLEFAQLSPPPQRIAAALARRDRVRAERFTASIDAVDRRLASPSRLGERETTQLMQGLSACL